MEQDITLPLKKEENLLQNGIQKTWLSGQLKKVMKIMSRFLNHKKLLDKLYLKWTKNTWRMSWELLMSKFNKDLWFNFKNTMF